MYLQDARYRGEHLGTSSTVQFCFGQRRVGSLAVWGSEMKLELISVFPSPLSPSGKTLLSQDTSKSLSDISRILVIFYLKQALLLDTVSPPPPPTPTTATIIVKIYPDCGLLTLHSSGMCLHSQSCNHCLIFLY